MGDSYLFQIPAGSAASGLTTRCGEVCDDGRAATMRNHAQVQERPAPELSSGPAKIEARAQELGLALHQEMQSYRPALRERFQNYLMALLMQDHTLRTRMLRFVDVLAALPEKGADPTISGCRPASRHGGASPTLYQTVL